MIDVNTIDWNEAWKKPEGEEGKKKGFISCGRRWSDPDRCKRFNDVMKEDNWAGSRARVSAMDIDESYRILDVGAGPGTLVIPLASIVAHVTAVEPSEGMLSCLRENIALAAITNVDIVPKKWEEVDVKQDLNPPYDVVVASYSLGFPDLREGILKMVAASSRYVYIFWFADMLSPWQRNYGEIWEKLYGIPRPSGNKPNIIYNLLHQMGIYANIDISKEESIHRYSSIEEAVADQKEGLHLTTSEQEDILRDYLGKKLIRENGKVVLREMTHRAKIWWNVNDQ
ncbi:methyltransferase [Methanospirillum hungatei JF-1]|uniref:Methyltransferase n=1 Tax=Methanospirillum hungatei JF-1 (strain ATCC 27890 / DSM 864 / NBRC 100397 / JF-1) TaxID=323259 RepID=Q2FME5_METHJ|nr:class I SAM-dependent methyltransferase [Methanospirillum hungatei]ABD41725.1 methyltransferase [Methanospirillum hungatei JF-1]MBP9007310.1 class I SAM-dependent methyltransferase [Methanospirillum sp.]OQA57655.1 MAG: N5-glutamine S-adenosyl-L-methionine-dependent methyltransferase [Euryarchaeota archaeon ADurb.Bin294]HOW04000.1 class I SAM-dependent methyltransferase [Methanospirillum hungatei]